MSKKAATAAKPSVYQIVTDRIISSLKAGVIPWEKPWQTPHFAGGPFPRNFRSGNGRAFRPTLKRQSRPKPVSAAPCCRTSADRTHLPHPFLLIRLIDSDTRVRDAVNEQDQKLLRLLIILQHKVWLREPTTPLLKEGD